LEKKLKSESETLTDREKNNIKKEIVKHKALANLYDKNNYHLKY
jgi:transcription elongation GreA/GreB family factor